MKWKHSWVKSIKYEFNFLTHHVLTSFDMPLCSCKKSFKNVAQKPNGNAPGAAWRIVSTKLGTFKSFHVLLLERHDLSLKGRLLSPLFCVTTAPSFTANLSGLDITSDAGTTWRLIPQSANALFDSKLVTYSEFCSVLLSLSDSVDGSSVKWHSLLSRKAASFAPRFGSFTKSTKAEHTNPIRWWNEIKS